MLRVASRRFPVATCASHSVLFWVCGIKTRSIKVAEPLFHASESNSQDAARKKGQQPAIIMCVMLCSMVRQRRGLASQIAAHHHCNRAFYKSGFVSLISDYHIFYGDFCKKTTQKQNFLKSYFNLNCSSKYNNLPLICLCVCVLSKILEAGVWITRLNLDLHLVYIDDGNKGIKSSACTHTQKKLNSDGKKVRRFGDPTRGHPVTHSWYQFYICLCAFVVCCNFWKSMTVWWWISWKSYRSKSYQIFMVKCSKKIFSNEKISWYFAS